MLTAPAGEAAADPVPRPERAVRAAGPIAVPAAADAAGYDSGEAVAALRALSLATDRFRHAVAGHFGVGLSETFAMSHLSASGQLSPRQLASEVGLTPSTVTALLDRLEGAGLARRAPHPTDRRKTVVSVTDRGEQLLAVVRQWMHTAVGVLEDEQLPAAAAMLRDLAAGLEAQAASIGAHRR